MPPREDKWGLKIDEDKKELNIYDYYLESYHEQPYPILNETEESIFAGHIRYGFTKTGSFTTINYNKKTGYTVVAGSDTEDFVIYMREGPCK